MNEYIGKICPFCKSEFKEDDEIVVCSACDMPHHKECWIENQGCTTFGCLGTITSAGDSETTVTSKEISYEDNQDTNGSTIYCTQCGAPSSNAASFCSKCGSRLTTNVNTTSNPTYRNDAQQQYSYQQSYDQYNGNAYTQQITLDNDVVQLIGNKSEYYVPKFQELKQHNKKSSWNWAAFLVAPYWFIYRKMYGYGYGILAATFILSLIPALSFFSLGGYIALGIFANYIYMNELEKKSGQAKTMNEPFRAQYIYKNGSTNTTAVVLTLIGYAILLGITSA